MSENREFLCQDCLYTTLKNISVNLFRSDNELSSDWYVVTNFSIDVASFPVVNTASASWQDPMLSKHELGSEPRHRWRIRDRSVQQTCLFCLTSRACRADFQPCQGREPGGGTERRCGVHTRASPSGSGQNQVCRYSITTPLLFWLVPMLLSSYKLSALL